jgi:hypothetical protein
MDYYKIYKPIRNQIMKYDSTKLLRLCSEKLFKVDHTDPYNMKVDYLPWELLFLIKRIAIESGIVCKNGVPQEKDLIKIINAIKEMTNAPTEFLKLHGPNVAPKFLRTIAFQQFWAQKGLNSHDLGRTLWLLTDKKSKVSPLEPQFVQQTKMSFSDYLQSMFALYTQFKTDQYLPCDSVRQLKTVFPEEHIDFLVDEMRCDLVELKAFFKGPISKINSIGFQIHEPSILWKKPLFSFENHLMCYSTLLLETFFLEFPFKILKSADEKVYFKAIGDSFELYISELMRWANVKFKNELELKNELSDESRKVADFVINLDECSVVMDAKAIEVSPFTQVCPSDSVLRTYYENSVTKGIKQIISISNAIAEGKIEAPSKCYGLVVTLNETYLGMGSNVFDEFANEPIEKYCSQNQYNLDVIPPSRIFFISIADFEYLMNASKHDVSNFIALLEKAEHNSNLDPKNRVFMIGQLLNDIPNKPHSRVIDFLDEKRIQMVKMTEDTINEGVCVDV